MATSRELKEEKYAAEVEGHMQEHDAYGNTE